MGFSSGIMGGIHGIATWVMRFAVVNIIWFILNLPFALIVFSALQHREMMGMILYSLPAIVLIPFLVFPTTAAMFQTARDWVMKREQSSLIKTYFSYLKTNYRQSIASGFVWTVIWLIWLIDFIYFYEGSSLLHLTFFIAGIFLFVMNINYFSILAHYHMKVWNMFRNSFFVTIGSPLLFISVGMIGFLLVTSSLEVWFLLPFFSGAIGACLSFYVFYRFTLKVGKKKTEL